MPIITTIIMLLLLLIIEHLPCWPRLEGYVKERFDTMAATPLHQVEPRGLRRSRAQTPRGVARRMYETT